MFSDTHITKLRGALSRSRKEMEPFYSKRLAAYREYVGHHYSGQGQSSPEPMNLIELAAGIYHQNLAATSPRVNVTARSKEHKPAAKSLSLALNHLLDNPDVESELELWVLESMFSPMGVLKVFLDVQEVQEIDGVQIWTGPPSLQAVMFDDWIQDMSAKTPQRVSFCGDRWQCSREWAMTSGVLDPDVVKDIPKREKTQAENYESQKLSRNGDCHDDDYREILEWWDIWLPDEGKVVTFYGDFEMGIPPARQIDWTGPKKGPYHRLWFGPVPGNALPNPPVGLWLDMHEIVNKLWNKMRDQAERQKTIGAVESSNAIDGTTLREASDGDNVVLTSLQQHAQIKSGGISQETWAFSQQARQSFSYIAGNMDVLGGLATMSGTVGQDQLLSQTASQRLMHMQSKVYGAMRWVVEAMAEYLLDDPLLEIPITKTIGNTGMQVETKWSKEVMGETSLVDYALDIEPYSMQRRSPTERLAQLQDVWRSDILPALPIFQALGNVPNPEAYLKEVAKLAQLPESIEFVSYPQGEGSPTEPAKPPQTTTRNYVRTSRSTKTMAGQEQQAMQTAMAGNKEGY